MRKVVRVSAPARLHFGLTCFGLSDEQFKSRRQYGGCGVMLDAPRVELELLPSDQFGITGLAAGRTAEFARRWIAQVGQVPSCKIHVHRVIPSHVGLGSGTQLAHAVVTGLHHFAQESESVTATDLVGWNGRVRRSAVGTYGFLQGGFIADHGKLSGEPLGQLMCRVPIPNDWQFLLIRPTEVAGFSGHAETAAFLRLPPVDPDVTMRLNDILRQRLIPACQRKHFEEFALAVYEYGIIAGRCFEPIQAGPFASATISQLVQSLLDCGVTGVGQSSWGPTVFVVTNRGDKIEDLKQAVRKFGITHRLCMQVATCRADNSGATVVKQLV